MYSFTAIADNTGPYTNLCAWPAVNGSGQVLFDAAKGPYGEGLVLSNGATTTEIAGFSSPNSGFGSDQVINNAGEVAWFDGSVNGLHNSVYTWSGGSQTTVANSSGFYSIDQFGPGPSMNNNGTVLFVGQSCATGRVGIYSGSGGAVTTIVDTSNGFSDFGLAPTINDAGTVAFSATDKTTGLVGLYTASNGAISKVVDTSGPIAAFLSRGAVNISNDGTLSFLAQLDSGDYAIYRGTAQSLQVVADTTGVFAGFEDQPIVNSQGQIAFVGHLKSGDTGIFTGPNPVADKIVTTSDVIGDETIVGIWALGTEFADNGWVTFVAQTQSGKEILYVGHPVPEPSALALAAIGFAGLAAVARRRRTRR